VLSNKEKSSLTLAIIATIVTAVVFLFLYLFLGINHRKDVYEDSKQIAKEISRKAAAETEIYLNSALVIGQSMQKRAILVKELGGSREKIMEILKDGLFSNPNFLATWTLWEPNVFDGKDNLFKNDSLYNKQGTLGLAFFRNNNSVYTETMTEADYTSIYYLPVKEIKTDIIVNPYKFRYSGYNKLYFGTTVSVPIIFKEQFLGVIGVDIDFKNLQDKLNEVVLYKTGYLSLIANNGVIITHADTTFITKNIFKLLNANDSLVSNAVQSGCELTTESKSEFTGKKVFRFFYPIKVGSGSDPWSMMVEIPIEEATVRSKELFYIAIGTLVVGLSLLLYLIINIADRKRYEKALMDAKAKAEESNRLKTAFLNNISHEIRTPLNGILGFTEMMVENGIDAEQSKAYKEIIHTSSNQLLSVISNVLELSKIQSCQLEKVINEFDVEKVLVNVIDSYTLEIKEKGLLLVKKFPKIKSNVNIKTDEAKFRQTLHYLLNNAIKFTKIGSVEVGYTEKENEYLFYVKDTGIGIKPENYKNIFKYFNQEDPTMTRNYGGLGVGLSISKSYIDLLGGTIWFESESGKGSTFYFTLPNM
jgi:signal transduction histidine kinase